ncbi:MAG: SufS family cysteine desulfurase [Cardiobacteriaceae bacterium]|nr:SufS family cysteine desulfurase [Cardiobacteriaceae bacterium]
MSPWRSQFPIMSQSIRGKALCYLDSGASTQKPECVIEAMNEVYRYQYSNVHRGVHALSQNLSLRYEKVRETVAGFVNAKREEEIVFTKGTTEALNLLAHSLSEMVLAKNDVVLISALEHHANIVPWQIATKRFGASLRVIPVNDDGELVWDNLEQLFEGVKILSITWVSNALGTVNPIKALIDYAKARGVYTIIDAAQAVAHIETDVQALDCDFLVFSGHKIYAPTGVGVLYGRHELLEKMPVYQSGGDMILSVSFEETIYAPAPLKFEAGTPPIVEVIGLGVALDWVKEQGIKALGEHEESLRLQAESALQSIDGVRIIGTAREKAAVISFVLDGIHPHDAGSIFDDFGVAVRVGHHCAEPVMKRFGVPATIRATFAAYNHQGDVAQLIEAIHRTQALFA